VRTVGELLHDYQHVIGDVTLVMGSGGVFDVVVDDTTLFSKKAIGRHADPGEVLALFRERVVPDVGPYER
jgi:selenoprotein W-related protein